MADHTENTLRAVVKALTDVVGPAIDKSDPLASEQLRLVVDYVEFVRLRLDYLYDRERFELSDHLTMAASLTMLRPPCSASVTTTLNDAIAAGEEAYARAGMPPGAMKTATAQIAAAISALVREAAAFEPAVRSAIERQVVTATDERIRFERSWYLPLGFDPSPGEVPALGSILAKYTATAASVLPRAGGT